MAKKQKAIEAAEPISDVSIPTLDHSHKNPAERTHVWERPARVDERPAEPTPFADYEHELPRWVHKGADQRFVTTPEDCEAAKADGYVIDPNEEA